MAPYLGYHSGLPFFNYPKWLIARLSMNNAILIKLLASSRPNLVGQIIQIDLVRLIQLVATKSLVLMYIQELHHEIRIF